MRPNRLEGVVPALSIVGGSFSVMSPNSDTDGKVGSRKGGGVVIARTGESGDADEWVGDLAGTAVAELAVAAALNVALRVPRGRD